MEFIKTESPQYVTVELIVSEDVGGEVTVCKDTGQVVRVDMSELTIAQMKRLVDRAKYAHNAYRWQGDSNKI